MELMHKRLSGFVSFLMFMSVLACSVAFCSSMRAYAGEQKPCHQQTEDNKKDGPMLAVDCIGVHLFQQDVQVKSPQLDSFVDVAYFTWGGLAVDYSFQSSDVHGVRAPPGWRSVQPPNPPSIILTTQRFRI